MSRLDHGTGSFPKGEIETGSWERLFDKGGGWIERDFREDHGTGSLKIGDHG
jgi:hypothetical protein